MAAPRPSYSVRAPTGDKEGVTRQPLALGLLLGLANIYLGDSIYYFRTTTTWEGSYLHIAKRRMEFERPVLQHTGECNGHDSFPRHSGLVLCPSVCPMTEDQTLAPSHPAPFELSLYSTRIRAN